MDTRYTMRLAAPLDAEDIPAFAERLADIIKGDPAKLEALLARGTKSLIRATSKDEAEKVAVVFRRAGLDVEVVPREQAAATPLSDAPVDSGDRAVETVDAPGESIQPAAAEPEPMAEPAAEPVTEAEIDTVSADAPYEEPAEQEAEITPPPLFAEAPTESEAPIEHEAATAAATEVAAAPEPFETPDSDTIAANAAWPHSDTDTGDPEWPDSDTVAATADAATAEHDTSLTPMPPDITRFDDSIDDGYYAARSKAPPVAPQGLTARLLGVLGALMLVVGPFLGAAAEGISIDLSNIGGNAPYGLIMAVLGLVSLVPIVMGRIRFLWIAAAVVLLAWGYALIDSGRISDLGSLLAQPVWLLFPIGALVMVIASVLPEEY